MNLKDAIKLLKSDYFRYKGCYPKNIWLSYFKSSSSFKYNFFLRLAQCYNNKKSVINLLVRLIRKIQIKKYKLMISKESNIGPGLCIYHPHAIRITGACNIGSNFTVGHLVTIGWINHGKKKGAPTIGDRVFVGPGAIVVGNIKIGDNVLIVGNSFVDRDIPSNSVVQGNPCIIHAKENPTEHYILNKI